MTTSDTSTPAAELREAARLMRERAQAAMAGPWQPFSYLRPGSYRDEAAKREFTTERVITPDRGGVAICDARADAEHIAGMHPDVALAVADLLDKIAWMGELDPDQLARVGCDEAIAIARAYLGESTEGSGTSG